MNYILYIIASLIVLGLGHLTFKWVGYIMECDAMNLVLRIGITLISLAFWYKISYMLLDIVMIQFKHIVGLL